MGRGMKSDRMAERNVPTARLGDICEKIGSGATPRGGRESYCDSGISLVRSQNVLDFSFSPEGLAFINDEQAGRLQNVEVREGDVLLNITGDSVARACMMDARFLPARVNQHVAIVRGKKNLVVSSFILYSLIFHKQRLLQLASSGATRNALTKKMIEDFEIYFPNIEEQQKIASILSSFDDKIEINNRINQILHDQAFNIFDNMLSSVCYDYLPEGWKNGKIGDIIELHDSKRIPISNFVREKMKNKIYPYYGATSIMDYVEDFIFDGTYLLLGEDGTVVDNNGFPILQYVWGKFWVNNHAHVITGKNGFTVESLYVMFQRTNVLQVVTGAVQQKISQARLKMIDIVIPSVEYMKKFNKIIEPLFYRIRMNTEESKVLTALRDSLLPRLMSGELDVSALDI